MGSCTRCTQPGRGVGLPDLPERLLCSAPRSNHLVKPACLVSRSAAQVIVIASCCRRQIEQVAIFSLPKVF